MQAVRAVVHKHLKDPSLFPVIVNEINSILELDVVMIVVGDISCLVTQKDSRKSASTGPTHLSCASITPSLQRSPKRRLLLEQPDGRLGANAVILFQCLSHKSSLFRPFAMSTVAASTRTSARTHLLTALVGSACTPRMHAAEISCSASSSELVSICIQE